MSSDIDTEVSSENLTAISGLLERAINHYQPLISRLLDNDKAADEVVRESLDWAIEQIPELAYANDPQHPMARSVYFCHANLAIYLSLRKRGVDAHTFGAAMLESMKQAPAAPSVDVQARWHALQNLKNAADRSQQYAADNEFVFEVSLEDEASLTWQMNVKSCAICKSYSQHDAMELVPYMCASDDVASDASGDGLRRTGTIALGAHHCDFRYRKGGEPAAVAQAYPQQIRLTNMT